MRTVILLLVALILSVSASVPVTILVGEWLAHRRRRAAIRDLIREVSERR